MKKYLLVMIWLLPIFVIKAEDYNVTALNLSNGLSNNYIRHIIEDKYGYLWFATEEGLNRFDGVRFFAYEKDEETGRSISSNELSRLLDDPKMPYLWVGTQHDGLNCFNYLTNSFSYFRHAEDDANSLVDNSISDLKTAQDGGFWIATRRGGIDYLESGKTEFEHFNTKTVRGLPDNQIQCVLDDGQGYLYVGHTVNGLSVISIKGKSANNFHHDDNIYGSLSDNGVICLTQDKTGNIWVGTNLGVDLFNPKTGSFIHITQKILGNQRIYDLRVFDDGLLWVATERLGIIIIDTKLLIGGVDKDALVSVIKAGEKQGTSLSGNDVRCLFEDRFGNVWAGLWEGGVNFITKERSTFYTIETDVVNGLMDKSVMGMCFDNEGKLWVGTNSFGINVLSSNLERKETIDGAPGPCVQTVFCDSQGHLWVGGFSNGLYWLNKGEERKRVLPRGDEDVRVLYEDKHMQMWVGTSDGVFVVDMKSLNVKERLMQGELVRAITQDTNGNVWVGTFGKGIKVLSPKGECIRTINEQTGCLLSDIVTQLMCDSKGRIWVATNEGAVCFRDVNDESPMVYNNRKGLLNNHIRALVEDNDHRIWMSTNKGISCLCEDENKVMNFTYLDNLPFTNFNDRSVAVASDGTIFFGSAGGGICYFHPQKVLKEQPKPLLHITSITVFQMDNKDIMFLTGQDEIRLSHDKNTLGIGFHVLNYAIGKHVEYSYRIEGLKNDWTLITDDNIMLQDLPYGNYKIFVRARLRNHEWSTPEMLEVCIMPPFWLTWWAKLIYLILAVSLMAYIFWNYKNRLQLKYQLNAEKKNREQEALLNEERIRFFTNVTHELRTPVTLILTPLSDLSKTIGNIPEKLRHKLAVCYQSAVRLNGLIDKLLDFRKVEANNRKLIVAKGNIVETVKEVCLKYEELVRNPDVSLQFHSCEPVIDIYFDREIITTVMENLMSNAVKYTSQGTIDIAISRKQKDGVNRIEISVSDTGYGISKDALPHIFERYYQENGPHQASGTGIGLALVKHLVDIHKGTISVTSTPAKGTCFIFSLDADNVYNEAMHGEIEQKKCDDVLTEDAVDIKKTNDSFSVLVVEDNRELREYLEESFGEEHEVFVAEDGKKGLALAIEHTPDIIVSDVMMPNMNGNQLCKTLKSDPRTSHIPIILLTAKDSDESRVEGYDAGADSYITKPFTYSLLLSRINNLIQSRKRMFSDIYSSSDSIEEKRKQLRESMNKVDQQFFDLLNEVIMENISGDLDLNLLTTRLAMSTSKLYKKIKTLTGLSPNEYIRKMKMRYAEQLILKGKYSISEISFMVGMNSVAYFRRCFKAEYGVLPSEYMKKLKSEGTDSRR